MVWSDKEEKVGGRGAVKRTEEGPVECGTAQQQEKRRRGAHRPGSPVRDTRMNENTEKKRDGTKEGSGVPGERETWTREEYVNCSVSRAERKRRKHKRELMDKAGKSPT